MFERVTPRRLVIAAAVAGALAFVLAARTFVAFDGVRVKMLQTALPADGGVARVESDTPEANRLVPPFAVIVRLRNDTATSQEFAIQLDRQPVCRVTIEPGRSSRADCVMHGEWQPSGTHEMTVASSASSWALEYAELATHHGRSNGLLDVRVIPAGARTPVPPAPVWIAIGWLVMAAGILLAPVQLPRWLRVSHLALSVAIVVLIGLALVSPWVSPYLVVISATAYGEWLGLLAAPRLWAGMIGLTRKLRAVRPGDLFHSAADPAVIPGGGQALHLAWASLGLCLFGAVLLHVQLLHMHSVPDLGDPLFSIWRVGWVSHQLQGDPRPLFDANIFYPEHLSLTFSDSMLLPSVTIAPLLAAGVHPVVAYNVLFISGFLASGLATYVLVARLTRSLPAAFIAALLFGFYPYRFEHYSHLELQMTEWMPLALLALHFFCTTLRVRYALAAALCMAANLYSSMYYGVFFVLYAIPVTGVLLLLARPPLRRLWPPVVAAGVLAAALAVPLARPYLAAQATKGERDIPAVTYYSAEPSDYVQAHARSALYGERLASHHPERALFPGVMALLLAALGLALPLGSTRLAYAVGLLIAFDASLGFHGLTYPYLYEYLSPIRGMRVAARFSVLVGLTLAVLAGFGAKRIFDRCATAGRRRIVFAALVVAIGIDLWPAITLEHVWDRPPAIYAALPRSSGTVLAEFPMHFHLADATDDVPFMYFSLWHWVAMVNGYSGFTPPSYEKLVARLEPFPAADAIDALEERGATHVSINCALYIDPRGCEDLLNTLDASPRFRPIVSTRWEGQTVRLYELRR
jgi:hypothetical protein